MSISSWIKNHIKSVELPKYQWYDDIVSYSLRDSISHIKFYATKNWIEIYIEDSVWFDSKNPQFTESQIPHYNNYPISLIVPKRKIAFYGLKEYHPLITDKGKKVLGLRRVNSSDYERHKEWHKK